ncbi:hypothetical protein D9M68_533940 [compost metagenome]
MQRGIGHGHTGHLDRLQPRHRGHRTGTADLELHVEQLGEFFLGRKLAGDGPVRRARTKAQLLLILDVVDLEHHAIDVVGQAHAPLADIAVVIQAGLHTLGQFQLAADGDAPGPELLEHADLGRRQCAAVQADAIAAELQRPAGGDPGVKLAQAAGSGIARVGEGLATAFRLARIELVKTGLGHEDLATHLQQCWPAFALQPERHVADGAHIGADVLANAAVTAGGATHQLTVLVQQADRQAIQLGLAAVLHLGASAEQVAASQAQSASNAAIEGTQVLLLEGVAQAEHGHLMAHLAERAEGLAAYPLGRRVGGHQLRMLGLQGLQLAEQAVVLGVGHAGLVQHVVAVVVRIQLGTQFEDAFGGGLGIGHGSGSFS